MANKLLLPNILAFTILMSSSFAIDSQDIDVLTRLSTVETSIATIQKENEDLRMENRKLREENAELKTRVVHIETEFKSYKEEFIAMKERLTEAKRYASSSKGVNNEPHLSEKTIFSKDKDKESEPLIKSHSEGSNESKTATDVLTSEKPKFGERIGVKPASQKEGYIIPSWQSRSRRLVIESKRLLMPIITTSASKVDIGSHISFSAHMGSHMTGLGTNQILKFDIENNNNGGAHDKLSGMFTCPVSGTYFFTASIFSHSSEETYASIIVNNVLRARIGADGKSGHYGSGTNSVVIDCNKEEEVWVRHEFPAHGTKVYGDRYSHFGGFLLW